MNWIKLESVEQINDIRTASINQPVLIFKHSTTCNISRAALGRLERNGDKLLASRNYFLDLHAHRPVSNLVAEVFGVPHESPQAILVKDGKAVFDRSHFEIDFPTIEKAVQLAIKN